MNRGEMSFSDIHGSLFRGELVHANLRSQNTVRNVLGRVFIHLKEFAGWRTSYNICPVAESILNKAERTCWEANSKEKQAAIHILGKLQGKLLDKSQDDEVAQNLALRVGNLKSRLQQGAHPKTSMPVFTQADVDLARRSTVSNPMRATGAAGKRTPASERAATLSPKSPMVIDRYFHPGEIRHQIASIFSSKGYLPQQVEVHSAALCQILNAQLNNLPLIQGNSVRFSKNTPIDIGGGQSVTLPFSAWIKVDSEGRGFRLQIIPPGSAIAIGGYKKVKKSFSLYLPIERKPDGTRDVRLTESVLQRVHNKMDQNGQQGNEIESVKKGIRFQEQILSLVGPGVRLVELPHAHSERIGRRGTEKLEIEQTWLNGDLHQAIHTQCIPLDIDRVRTRPIQFKDRLTFALDIANSLEAMHKAGLVHRDVKPANILLKNENNEMHAYLSDFDLTTLPGMTGIAADYLYWDSSSQAGYASYSADVVGCAMTVAETFIPGFYARFGNNRESLVENNESKYQEFAYHHLQDRLTQINLSPTLVEEVTALFNSSAGNPLEFKQHLEAFVSAHPDLKAQQAESLKKLGIESSYFQAITGFVSNIVAKDSFMKWALEDLPPEVKEAMRTNATYQSQVYEWYIQESDFPSMSNIAEFFKSLGEDLIKDYRAAGLTP